MKYCCDEHLREATNNKQMQKYYEKKARKNGARRECLNEDCTTVLSRYNVSKVCAKCEAALEARTKQKLIEMLKR